MRIEGGAVGLVAAADGAIHQSSPAEQIGVRIIPLWVRSAQTGSKPLKPRPGTDGQSL